MDYSRFNLNNYGTFKQLEILQDIISLGSSATLLNPIVNQSILITLDENHKFTGIDLLENAILTGTKPIDALVYMLSQKNDALMDLFKFVGGERKDEGPRKIAAVKLTASMILIFVSRGSLPSASGRSAGQVLPKFIKSLIGESLNLATEGDLANALASFDMAHLNMSRFFETKFVGWDKTVLNRMNLGVAGHKPLKVALALQPVLDIKSDNIYNDLSSLLLRKAIMNGIYPTLHPVIQSVGNKYNEFYKTCIFALYQAMTGDNKLERLRNLSMLRMDTWVNSNEFTTYLPKYHSWTLSELYDDIGEPILLGNPDLNKSQAKSGMKQETGDSEPKFTKPKQNQDSEKKWKSK